MFVQPKNIKIHLNGNNIKLMCATKKTSKDPQILHGVIISPCSDDRTISQDGHIPATNLSGWSHLGHTSATNMSGWTHLGHTLAANMSGWSQIGHTSARNLT